MDAWRRHFGMKIEHVVYLSSAGCALWSWHETYFVESPVRSAVGADPAPVAAELCRLEPGPVAVLVDMVDEEHACDTVARLGRRDQQRLLERKLARAYPRTVLRCAGVQGRSAGSPDEDQLLLSALTRPEPVRALLQRLAEARLPLAGVFSPALLTGELLDAAARAAPAVMVVLRRSNGRLQHSLFRKGRLAGSRRLRAQAEAANTLMTLRLLEESLRYFDASYAVGADCPLQVLLASADAPFLESAESRGEGWQARALDFDGLRQRLRFSTAVADIESERLFIELLRERAPALNFAPAADRRYFGLFRVRSYATVACLALAGLAMVGTLRNTLYILDASKQLAGEVSMAQTLEQVLPAHGEGGAIDVDPLEMQQVVSSYDALERRQAQPQQILAAIGAAVSSNERIRIDAIEWHVGPAPDAVAADVESGPEPVDAALADDITVTLRGHVQPFNGNYPLAFDELAAFVETLRSAPAVQAVTSKVQPLDVSPASTLSGELAGGRSEAQAPFALQIIMRMGHEPA